MQAENPLAVIFIPKKEVQLMAKAKYTRGKDGFFRTKIWDGTYCPDGSKRRVILSSKKSSADLEKKVNDLKTKVKNGEVVQQTEKLFIAYAREWKTTYKDVREGNTARMYENIIEKHLIALDKVKLCDIRRTHFQLVINSTSDRPCTCNQIALTFRQIIKTAVREKMLPPGAYNDICEGIDLPRYKAKEKRALYPEEVAAVKTADFTPMERCFVYIIYGCGMRRGEVLALNKDFHIDLKKGVIKVNSSVMYRGNIPEIKQPKSQNSFRQVPMPGFLVSFLKGYIPSLEFPYLVHGRDGGLMTESAYKFMWKQIVRKMNRAAGGTDNIQVIYGITAHVFRHNYCTNLCYQVPAISIKKVAQLMGDTEAVVLRTYNHIMEEKENVESVVNGAIAL